MMPLFASPWLLAVLIAVPLLVAIYLFQRRFKSREVSSLLLWEAIGDASMGGRTREPLRLPLPFWLELVAIVLLVLAAAGPLVAMWRRSRPLVIVLDDSFSMGAGDVRERAREIVRDVASRGDYEPVRVVFAGATPQLASGPDLDTQLRGWNCTAATADLDAAIVFATQVGGPNALVLVATDHAPSRTLEDGNLEWRAFGERRANAGFVAAARGPERMLLEVGGFGASRATLTVSAGPRVLHRGELALAPGSRTRVQLHVGKEPVIEASLSADGAEFDDRVSLLADERPPVRVALAIRDATLRAELEDALRATARALVTDVRPDLTITDGAPPADGWSVVLHTAPGANAFVGPYVVDRTSPLATGLELHGAIWGASRGALPGEPVVLVGDQALISASAHRVDLRFDPAISNVQRSPAWPALWWNVLEWRATHLPGVRPVNVTVGGQVRAVTPEKELLVAATEPGIHSIGPYRYATNALVPAESDFTGAASGTWGGWSESALTANGAQDVAWGAILLALAVLVFHQRTFLGGRASRPPLPGILPGSAVDFGGGQDARRERAGRPPSEEAT